MKWFILIASLTVLLSCKQSKTTSDAPTTTISEKINNEVIPLKEALFLSMERTPCFGKCPNYKITIMNTGKVTYEGIQFTDKIGLYSKQLSSKQLSQIQKRMEDINLFEMNSKYDSNITDIPAVALFIIYKANKKKIYDRYGGPKDLREFEKLIDSIVIDDQLIKVEE
ncbi:DUF6438 domain-containing protein [Vicingaceae bacterium]|nr:DUF6438 domain-containing protein [Vicingaceae bacterium]